MPAINTIIRRVKAAFNMPRSIPQFIAKAKNIVMMITGNANFPTPFPSNIPSLAAVNADILALENAESLALTKAKGTADARDVKKSIVENDLRALLRYVQGIADNDPEKAEAIILSSGFSVKKPPQRVKSSFEAVNGKVSGTVLLRAKATARRASYEWQMSADNINWSTLPSTLSAKTEVKKLSQCSILYFRFRAVTKAGESSWSQTVSIVVL